MGIDILSRLKKAILEYDEAEAVNCARKVVEEGINPVEALNAMTVAIRQVGDGFGSGELFLPDLVGAADAMSAATPILEEEISRSGASRESLGIIVIGTVYGDIHTIGKTMVATLLSAEGFQVIDLGINVTAEGFIEGVKKHNANILAMSALLTTTAPEQRKVIDLLNKGGIRDKIKVIVGGGAITQEFADSIGADGYDPTAPGSVKLVRKLMGI